MYKYRGTYSSVASYDIGDVVNLDGENYVKVSNEEQKPTEPKAGVLWHKVAQPLSEAATLLASAVADKMKWVGEVDTDEDGKTGDIGYIEDNGDLYLCIWIEEAWYTVALTEVT